MRRPENQNSKIKNASIVYPENRVRIVFMPDFIYFVLATLSINNRLGQLITMPSTSPTF
jgi:hypothetical protein